MSMVKESPLKSQVAMNFVLLTTVIVTVIGSFPLWAGLSLPVNVNADDFLSISTIGLPE